jgi:DNA-directed RNA polymerase subunit M/transcription elongation factor TFIIS
MGLGLFSRNNNTCGDCKEKMESYNDLINHARHVHHKRIVKCSGCGKEFIHEKDRLHHAREEHQQKVKSRYQ